jgi:hypothetical protein
MTTTYIRKEVRVTEKRMIQIEAQMEYFQNDNQAQYLRDLIDIGFHVKQKEIDNTQKQIDDLEAEAHLSSLITHELLLIKMGVGSIHIPEATQENIQLYREKLKGFYDV